MNQELKQLQEREEQLIHQINGISDWAGLGFLAPIMAVCLAIGVFAGIVTWVAGPSSGLLTVAKGGYLPRFWQQTNKKSQSYSGFI